MKGTLSAIFTEARNPDLYAGPKLIPMEPTTGLEPGTCRLRIDSDLRKLLIIIGRLHEFVRHPDQRCERVRFHLPHNVPAM